MKIKYLVTFISILCFNLSIIAQENNKNLKIGFNYGIGKQNIFPYKTNDYLYKIQFYKIQLNYSLIKKNNFKVELNIEPSYYKSKHQLLNEHFIKPSADNFLEKRAEYTQLKTMNEYVLGIGVIGRYTIYKPLSAYILGSIGPMYINTVTERLAKGFSFSDVLSLGFSYELNSIILDFRYTLRHVSNANIKRPNSGYNTTGIEIGFLFFL